MKSTDQSLNMHRCSIVTVIIAVYTTAIFSTISGAPGDVVHICCYSSDPSSYDPKCYDCDSLAYENALKACVNMTELPKNISFKAATCLEKNCQVQIPKMAKEVEAMQMDPFVAALKALFERSKRSLFDNGVEGSDISKNRHVVKEVATFVSGEEPTSIKYIDAEYM